MEEAKIIELTETSNALAELSNALSGLNSLLEEKGNSLKNERQQQKKEAKAHEAALSELKMTSENIIHNIDGVISRLDKVLENDGTDNHNN